MGLLCISSTTTCPEEAHPVLASAYCATAPGWHSASTHHGTHASTAGAAALQLAGSRGVVAAAAKGLQDSDSDDDFSGESSGHAPLRLPAARRGSSCHRGRQRAGLPLPEAPPRNPPPHTHTHHPLTHPVPARRRRRRERVRV